MENVRTKDGELMDIPLNLRASLGKLIINLYIDKEPRTPIITPSLVKVIDVLETDRKVKKKKNKFLSGFGLFGGDDKTEDEGDKSNSPNDAKVNVRPKYKTIKSFSDQMKEDSRLKSAKFKVDRALGAMK